MWPISPRLGTAIGLALAMASAAATTNLGGRGLPASAPLSLAAGAAPTTLQIRIPVARLVAVQLRFEHGSGAEAARRGFELLGGARADATGRYTEPGVPARFRVRIARADGSGSVVEAEIANPPTQAGHNARWARLAEPRLEAGEYRIEIHGTTESDALRKLRIDAVVGAGAHGK